jgi:hypothetical protein
MDGMVVRRSEAHWNGPSAIAAICNGDDGDPVRLNTNRVVGIMLGQQGLTPNLATMMSWSEIA